MVFDYGTNGSYARDGDFQVQGNVPGRFGRRTANGRPGPNHSLRQTGRGGDAGPPIEDRILARFDARLYRNPWRHCWARWSISWVHGRPEMRLLLDTHVWLWADRSPEKLGRKILRELERPANELYLSPVSIWEAHHLERRKRLRLRKPFSEWVDEALSRAPLKEAPFNFAVASTAAGIDLPQSDLGDVFLAATALVFDLTLVTFDQQLLACSWLKTLPPD